MNLSLSKYFAKRLFHTVPTIFGVILLTFLLFNMIGGSPATMTLGKYANAQELENFDEQKGFNKPLLFGWWVKTRALNDVNFDSGNNIFSQQPGSNFNLISEGEIKYVRLSTNKIAIPLSTELFPNTKYRLSILYRTSADNGSCYVITETNNVSYPLTKSEKWKETTIDFVNQPTETKVTIEICNCEGWLDIKSIRLRRGIQNCFDSQFIFYLNKLIKFDLGRSSESGQRIASILKQGAIPSLCIALPILVGSILVSLAISLISVYFHNCLIDKLILVISTALMSINYIIWVIAGQYFLSFKLGWFPIWGFESWQYLILPILIGIISGLGRDVRLYRAVLLDERYRDYVRTALAKGAGSTRVLFRHVLPNALLPIITNISLSLPLLFTGNLLLESFYGIPGLGGLSLNAINSSDLEVVQAIVLVGALLYVFVNLITDLCYAWADPRIRLD